jgi:hypothetical protein
MTSILNHPLTLSHLVTTASLFEKRNQNIRKQPALSVKGLFSKTKGRVRARTK